jgi:hypothetical protein
MPSHDRATRARLLGQHGDVLQQVPPSRSIATVEVGDSQVSLKEAIDGRDHQVSSSSSDM